MKEQGGRIGFNNITPHLLRSNHNAGSIQIIQLMQGVNATCQIAKYWDHNLFTSCEKDLSVYSNGILRVRS